MTVRWGVLSTRGGRRGNGRLTPIGSRDLADAQFSGSRAYIYLLLQTRTPELRGRTDHAARGKDRLSMPLLASARCLLSEQGDGNMRERPAAGRRRRWPAAVVTVFLAGPCLGAPPTTSDRADVAGLAAAVKQRSASDYAFLE